MKYLSKVDIERIGERIVQAYKNLPEFRNKKVYSVSPDILIEKVLKMNMEYHHLSLNGSVLGVTTSYINMGYRIFDNDDTESFYYFDGNTILIERDLKNDVSQKGRLHFTQVHEAGHQILMRFFPNDYNGGYRKLHFYKTNYKPIMDWEEWQVNTLTSVILMPYDLVKQAMFLLNCNDRFSMINRVYAKAEYEKFSLLADFLGVSKQAMYLRLKQLGFIERDYFDDPYALTDVNNY